MKVKVKLKTLREISRTIVVSRLAHHGGNKRAACKSLGIAYHTLQGHLEVKGVRRQRERTSA